MAKSTPSVGWNKNLLLILEVGVDRSWPQGFVAKKGVNSYINSYNVGGTW